MDISKGCVSAWGKFVFSVLEEVKIREASYLWPSAMMSRT